MQIKPITWKCEGCGNIGYNLNAFLHEDECPLVSQEVFNKKVSLLSQWLKEELPQDSTLVYGWPGLDNIAQGLLVKMGKHSLFTQEKE